MTTLVWLFLSMSVIISGYISNRATAWYYKRKMNKSND